MLPALTCSPFIHVPFGIEYRLVVIHEREPYAQYAFSVYAETV